MDCTTNQAVIFTKPVHHLGISLTPEELNRQVLDYLEGRGFAVVKSRTVTGSELAGRDVIRQHYLMYSQASYGDAVITDEGKSRFRQVFDHQWEDAVATGRILPNPLLMKNKSISAHELYLLWNAQFGARLTEKIQEGVIVAWLRELDCYCINAFYPAMEENFYHPETRIDYHVVEFDPTRVSWSKFRKEILGSTDASKAVPASFRATFYERYQVEFPGRDNFIHGSAGPIEAFIERIIHEPDFDPETNPVGHYLAERQVGLDSFSRWKSGQSISDLGALFDQTEELDCSPALVRLDNIRF